MKLGKKESEFLSKNEVCRLATIGEEGPHVVPVCYIFRDGFIYIVTDYGTKKYKNVVKDRRVALVVDVYRPGAHKAVMIQGDAEILEGGEEYRRISEEFFRKFKWAREDPWKEGESPIFKIKPVKVVSWGL
jgi:nitroimidazol reductase NimA-like FMN-containing flavoprotein (pyridoxamine 5'-phosphate oxidase superfamily)